MRYLSSISLALIVHVLLSIVALMALACTATPAWKAGLWLPGFAMIQWGCAPTPIGPNVSR